MKFFDKKEFIGISIILVIILAVSLLNFRISLRRARDSQRKDDLGSLSGALVRYQEDFGVFPVSSNDGKIVACRGKDTKVDPIKKVLVNLIACEWGKDGLADLTDVSFPPYLKVLPLEPRWGQGAAYLYFSNGRRFQLYAALEGKSEDEYNPKVVARGLKCGSQICNFGKSFGSTPLDKSIEEYENELLVK